jgi:hypothetical protein
MHAIFADKICSCVRKPTRQLAKCEQKGLASKNTNRLDITVWRVVFFPSHWPFIQYSFGQLFSDLASENGVWRVSWKIYPHPCISSNLSSVFRLSPSGSTFLCFLEPVRFRHLSGKGGNLRAELLRLAPLPSLPRDACKMGSSPNSNIVNPESNYR